MTDEPPPVLTLEPGDPAPLLALAQLADDLVKSRRIWSRQAFDLSLITRAYERRKDVILQRNADQNRQNADLDSKSKEFEQAEDENSRLRGMHKSIVHEISGLRALISDVHSRLESYDRDCESKLQSPPAPDSDERLALIDSLKRSRYMVDSLKLRTLKNAVIGIVAEAESTNNTLQVRELDSELSFYESQLRDCARRTEDAARRLSAVIDPIDADAKAATAAEDEVDPLEIQFNHSGMEQALMEADAEYSTVRTLSERNRERKVTLDRRRRRLDRSKKHHAERAARGDSAHSPDRRTLLQNLKKRSPVSSAASRAARSDARSDARSEASQRSRVTVSERTFSRIDRESRALDTAEMQFACAREEGEAEWGRKMDRLTELIARANEIDGAELRCRNARHLVELGRIRLEVLNGELEEAKLAHEKAFEKGHRLTEEAPVVDRSERLYERSAKLRESQQRVEQRKARAAEAVKVVVKLENEAKGLNARNDATDGMIANLEQQIEEAMGLIEKEMREWDLFNPAPDK